MIRRSIGLFLAASVLAAAAAAPTLAAAGGGPANLSAMSANVSFTGADGLQYSGSVMFQVNYLTGGTPDAWAYFEVTGDPVDCPDGTSGSPTYSFVSDIGVTINELTIDQPIDRAGASGHGDAVLDGTRWTSDPCTGDWIDPVPTQYAITLDLTATSGASKSTNAQAIVNPDGTRFVVVQNYTQRAATGSVQINGAAVAMSDGSLEHVVMTFQAH